MTDTTWAAKVLADVPRHSLDFCDQMEIDKDGVWLHVDDVLAAIAKLGAGDGLAASNALIDLIGELGREVHYLIDGCETSGDKGDEVHTIEGQNLERVSALLDQIEALPFEEPGVILGPGAMLQAALKQTFLAHIAALTAQLAEKEEQLVSVLRREAATHKRHDERVARLEALNPNRPNELTDPIAVHANMLRGTIAKPTVEQIIHLYGVDALCKALVPVIVQEADVNKTPKCERDLSNVLTESAALRAKLARIASAWPIVRDADCSGGTLASAMDEIEAAIADGGKDA